MAFAETALQPLGKLAHTLIVKEIVTGHQGAWSSVGRSTEDQASIADARSKQVLNSLLLSKN